MTDEVDGYFNKTNKNKKRVGMHYRTARKALPATDPLLKALTMTLTEQKVIECVSTGAPLRNVAMVLGIGVGGVKFHLTKIYKKIKVTNIVELIVYLAQAGYYDPRRIKL